MRRDDLDLHAILPEHIAVHERCLNWSICVQDSLRSPVAQQPMFRPYRPYLVPRESSARIEGDEQDAMRIEKAVRNLPGRHAYAIRWAYVFNWRPEQRARRVLGATRRELANLIHDARSMLKHHI